MNLPNLDPGTVVFIPRHGLHTVICAREQVIGDTTQDICDLQHYFEYTTSSRTVDSLERLHARIPTNQQTAYDIVTRVLHVPPRRGLEGPWPKQRTEIERRLNLGTLEKNLEVVRLIHYRDHDHRNTAQAELYQHALKLAVEELAYVFDEPLKKTAQLIVATLNKTVAAHV